MEILNKFEERIGKYRTDIAAGKTASQKLSRLRLLCFTLAVALPVFLLYKKLNLPALCTFLPLIVLFAFLVSRHEAIKKKLIRLEHLQAINGEYLDRITGKWHGFPDSGEEWLDPEHPYAADINLFGKKSLFQLVNCAGTFMGRKRLAELLLNPPESDRAILGRQKAVSALTGLTEFRQQLQVDARLMKGPKSNPEPLLSFLSEGHTQRDPWYIHGLLLYGMPLCTLLTAVLGIVAQPFFYYFMLSLIIVQFLLFGLTYGSSSSRLKNLYGYKNQMETYSDIIRRISGEDFGEEELNRLKASFTGGEYSAARGLRQLSVLADCIDMKYGPLLYFLLNAVFLWDLHCLRALNRWKRENGAKVRAWLEALGEMEALSSLSVVAEINPAVCYPQFAEKGPVFTARGLGHIFIPADKRAVNDVSVKNGIAIITGSNMSGKTTLLRTIGISLVLAYSGAPVPAGSLTLSLMSLYTSMRNTDDLGAGISTFYAELLRIKKIAERARVREPMLFLIDEIFKGTNSKDRIEGARRVLKSLVRPWITGLISTHDYELCDLEKENPLHFENYHFVETYKDNTIHFDYRLHRGRCTTSNAIYLIKMLGIDE